MSAPTFRSQFNRLGHRMSQNLVWGVRLGLVVAGMLCCIGVPLALVGIGDPVTHERIPAGTLVVVYLSGGFISGIVLGLARPLARWRVGAIAIGIADGVICAALINMATDGAIWGWHSMQWIVTVIMGTSIGGITANWFWEDMVEPSLPGPELPPGPPPPRRPLGLWRPK